MRVEAMIAFATLALLGCLLFLTCGCTYLRVPISNNEHITYIRFLEKRTLSITDPTTGNTILLSTSDGGTEAAGAIAGAAIKSLVR